jgi:uncharacterized membrane protein YidH (DUF202 family)
VALKLIGGALIILGILALVFGGIRYTKRENVLKVGPLEATTEEHKMIPISPVFSIAAIAGGAALIVASSRRSV